jgi:hypothetical protein
VPRKCRRMISRFRGGAGAKEIVEEECPHGTLTEFITIKCTNCGEVKGLDIPSLDRRTIEILALKYFMR